MQFSISILLPLLSLASATRLRITVPTTPQLPHPGVLPASTHASLTTLSKRFTAPLRFDNTFDFQNVTSGSYLLDVHCHSHGFAPLRVDVLESAATLAEGDEAKVKEVQVWGTFRGNEWSNKGEVVEVRSIGGVHWFAVRALGAKEYLLERPGFQPLDLFKNPMILLAVFSLGLVFGMPYLMENMDPELKEEFEKSKTRAPNPTTDAIQNFDAAAWLAGKSTSSGKSTPRSAESGVSR